MAKLQAEQLYFEAMRRDDLSAARNAATNWQKAADAFSDYVAKHTDLYRDSG